MEISDSIDASIQGTPNGTALKQAACLNCRRIKIRCHRGPQDQCCNRCHKMELQCIIPEFHIGRRKGTRNKRTGLDKAVQQIEQAIERSKTSDGQLANDQTAMHLKNLLSKTQTLLPRDATSGTQRSEVETHNLSPRTYIQTPATNQSYIAPSPGTPELSAIPPPSHLASHENYELDDAENPLQLLARASDLPIASPDPSLAQNHPTSTTSNSSRLEYLRHDSSSQDLGNFFGPFTPHYQLDIGEDIDPIDLGFTTVNEAEALFAYFFQNLSHTRWGLDPIVHTPSFVRKRSSFLFTSILAASALFLPATAALSKRLSNHSKNLANHVMIHRNRSPEIVLAFMVNIPWMSPGKHWADDASCSYLAMALTIATDISLNKLIVPSPGSLPDASWDRLPKSDCITATKALSMDGFDNVDPRTNWGRRLLRRRERIWLALFVLDRGVCLARGRPFTMPMSPLIEICDKWHISDLADTWDGSIISSAVLRRELVTLIAEIKSTCDGNTVLDGSSIEQSIKDMIENFFNRWYATWAFAIEGSKQHYLPPYVDILVSHTRLSTYSSVINHPTAPIEVKRFFHAAGLSSALNVMRAAVQGEGQLKSMPNNTAIMISFAACFALCLITMSTSKSLSLASSIKILIEETADVLERIGTIPTHRKGMSALYGRHLREVVRNTVEKLDKGNSPAGMGMSVMPQDHMGSVQGYRRQDSSLMAFEPLLFSAMTDQQIVEAISSAEKELETVLPGFQVEDSTGLDWLDWFGFDPSMPA